MSQFSFLAKTAYRDSRRNRGKLAMFMSSIILGIAALVAINSFNYNLVEDVDEQALSILGADYVVSGNNPPNDEVKSMLDSLPGDTAKLIELFSMSFMPKEEQTQFVRIKAVKGAYPFYGKMVTEPTNAAQSFKGGNQALVDEGMMINYNLQVGDSIRLGSKSFVIGGKLISAVGSTGAAAAFAPSVFIDFDDLEATKLVQPGSLLDYNFYWKLPKDFEIDQWDEARKTSFRNSSLRTTTLAEQKRELSEAFSNLNYFLNLVALVSLLLGCIGVASSVFIYVKTKINSIAIFRCLGMKGNQAFTIYFLQIFVLGAIGVLVGAFLGSAIQLLIPVVLSDLLPFEVTTDISWRAIGEGVSIGLIITTLFALLPLVSVRKISPLRTLRTNYDGDTQDRDPLTWIINIAIVLFVFLFLWRLTSEVLTAAGFTAGLIAAFLLLWAVSKLIIWAVKKFFPRHWSFVLRQGLSNLFRPNNQTQTLLVSIGLGTSILTTLFIIQGLLLNNVAQMDVGKQPNVILYGIEKSQSQGVEELTDKYHLPIIQNVPIVTMKVEGWKGKSKLEWLQDTTTKTRFWAANREARVTYRDTLDESEKLVKGSMPKPVNHGDSVFISVDEGWAEGLNLDIGDEVVFNVQGTRIKTYIGAFRDIEFRSMATRFFVVFPTGVLEKAPQFMVVVTKSPDNTTTAQYRREVVKNFPNVSVVDLGSILAAVGEILKKVSYIIQFMAAFSILTGLIVLLSSLLLSKYQRIKESVLLRTLGASRRQILRINATEYALLGALSAATGIFISIAGSYLLATFQLEMDYNINWLPILAIFFIVTGLTVLIGLFNSKEVVSKSPLEVLRNEVG
jgi:putative ABC transport system permease protein